MLEKSICTPEKVDWRPKIAHDGGVFQHNLLLTIRLNFEHQRYVQCTALDWIWRDVSPVQPTDASAQRFFSHSTRDKPPNLLACCPSHETPFSSPQLIPVALYHQETGHYHTSHRYHGVARDTKTHRWDAQFFRDLGISALLPGRTEKLLTAHWHFYLFHQIFSPQWPFEWWISIFNLHFWQDLCVIFQISNKI